MPRYLSLKDVLWVHDFSSPALRNTFTKVDRWFVHVYVLARCPAVNLQHVIDILCIFHTCSKKQQAIIREEKVTYHWSRWSHHNPIKSLWLNSRFHKAQKALCCQKKQIRRDRISLTNSPWWFKLFKAITIKKNRKRYRSNQTHYHLYPKLVEAEPDHNSL